MVGTVLIENDGSHSDDAVFASFSAAADSSGVIEMCLHFFVIASSLESSSYNVEMTEYMVSLLKRVSVVVFFKRTSKAISERRVVIMSRLDEVDSHASIVVYNDRGFKEVIHLTKSILEMSDIDWQFNDMSLPTKCCSHCFKPLESDIPGWIYCSRSCQVEDWVMWNHRLTKQ
jgi:hypothetical protein|eukprot:scaffold13564_cov128-Alexandrium_tamarense.AAC.16